MSLHYGYTSQPVQLEINNKGLTDKPDASPWNRHPDSKMYPIGTKRHYTASTIPFPLPIVSCWAVFLNFPCIQILYIFNCRFLFTSKRLSGASNTISNKG